MSIVQLTGITRTYRTGSRPVEALRGIDFEVNKGEFAAIMGASGSGKSTLMNILGCLDRPSSGRYLLRGEDVSTFPRERLAAVRNRMLGFVFQAFHLLPRTTALENVELPLIYREDELNWNEIHKRAMEALQTVGLGDRAEHSPNELSGGQKQRVAIARALVSHPSLLLADEPTGNLDSRTSLEIIEIFQKLNREGLTILMVTHEPDIAHFAGRTIKLRDGLVQSDKPGMQLSATDELAGWQDESESFRYGIDE
ncbi:MAG: ABC transporter ATP-binding protein [Balneolaceae bacterium]